MIAFLMPTIEIPFMRIGQDIANIGLDIHNKNNIGPIFFLEGLLFVFRLLVFFKSAYLFHF